MAVIDMKTRLPHGHLVARVGAIHHHSASLNRVAEDLRRAGEELRAISAAFNAELQRIP